MNKGQSCRVQKSFQEVVFGPLVFVDPSCSWGLFNDKPNKWVFQKKTRRNPDQKGFCWIFSGRIVFCFSSFSHSEQFKAIQDSHSRAIAAVNKANAEKISDIEDRCKHAEAKSRKFEQENEDMRAAADNANQKDYERGFWKKKAEEKEKLLLKLMEYSDTLMSSKIDDDLSP